MATTPGLTTPVGAHRISPNPITPPSSASPYLRNVYVESTEEGKNKKKTLPIFIHVDHNTSLENFRVL